MNKKDKTEYTANKEDSRRDENMVMDENYIHDILYTFADEYYSDLRNDYYEALLEDMEDEEESS